MLSNDDVYINTYNLWVFLKTPELLRIGHFCFHLRTISWTQSALWCTTKQSATTGYLSDRWMRKMKDPHIQNARKKCKKHLFNWIKHVCQIIWEQWFWYSGISHCIEILYIESLLNVFLQVGNIHSKIQQSHIWLQC